MVWWTDMTVRVDCQGQYLHNKAETGVLKIE